ncbi:hypothetical protein GJ688_00180 [Heliobacillus mobilis]|uniref:Uncharacterized protein n=1 Tax=Heliobacterium mobile TaxID=28064 RepID=A0A6I3SAZ9_HELMO|nr:hypothetical protein [Heliobacterium mobile]
MTVLQFFIADPAQTWQSLDFGGDPFPTGALFMPLNLPDGTDNQPRLYLTPKEMRYPIDF